jgi:hypothetical protein
MRLPIANERRVGFGNVIEKVIDRFVQRFRSRGWSERERKKNQGREKMRATSHIK